MSIEAMKQALEALEEIHAGNMTPMAEEAWNKAITSLRQAIAEAEKQEPVAWIDRTCLKNLSDNFEPTIGKRPVSEYDIPLYTRPQPKREWVGLTEDEITECFKITPDQYLPWQIYRRIEAKLKEKNT